MVAAHEFKKMRTLVKKYAPAAHEGMTIRYVSVIGGGREGAHQAVTVMIDAIAPASYDQEMRDAAEEAVTHAIDDLHSGAREYAIRVEMLEL